MSTPPGRGKQRGGVRWSVSPPMRCPGVKTAWPVPMGRRRLAAGRPPGSCWCRAESRGRVAAVPSTRLILPRGSALSGGAIARRRAPWRRGRRRDQGDPSEALRDAAFPTLCWFGGHGVASRACKGWNAAADRADHGWSFGRDGSDEVMVRGRRIFTAACRSCAK